MMRRSQLQKHGGSAFQAEERASAKTLRWAEFGMFENNHKASVIKAEGVEGWQDIKPCRPEQGICILKCNGKPWEGFKQRNDLV